jgi:3-oxoacyl-[acyl-carrier protein] reductase
MTVLAQSWAPHDDEMPWGRDPLGITGVIEELRKHGPRLEHVEADFARPEAPAEVVDLAVQLFGHVDAIVANHATNAGTQLLDEVMPEDLDPQLGSPATVER